MRNDASGRGLAMVVGAWLGLCAVAWLIAGGDLDRPGLYYDEVVQAEPAVQFLAADGSPSALPGAKSIRLFGGWFPLMTQSYMGAAKSQALIPVFALFGASQASLRLTTLAWGALGLLLAMLWARRLLGTSVALVAGCLVVSDASFLFVSRHDWGSFALGFVFRSAGLLALTGGFASARPAPLLLGGLLFGLGLYNKIDFAVFLAACAAALLCLAPGALLRGVRELPRRAVLPALGLALGAAPLIASLGSAVAATRFIFRSRGLGSADLGEKLHTMVSTLDGSYFLRLMQAGGSFEAMFEGAKIPENPFFWILLASALGLLVALARDARSGGCDRKQAFVLLATVFCVLGILLTPRAVRVHHALNVYPFPHLVVAIALVRLWRTRAPGARAAAVLAGVAALAGGLATASETAAVIRETGGKGRWSDALARFAGELEEQRGAVVVSLDWGFHGPLRFASRDLELVEPVWRLWRPPSPRQPWIFEGTPRHVYLLYDADLAVFDFGREFLDALAALPPGSAEIRRHADRTGDPAFLSVRIARPHRLVYREGFEVRLR